MLKVLKRNQLKKNKYYFKKKVSAGQYIYKIWSSDGASLTYLQLFAINIPLRWSLKTINPTGFKNLQGLAKITFSTILPVYF
ncbi:hypothetical protein B0A67_08320 [Flavobacterium aquidurense]|nr:hypothetical protein B0A67_08320 [Flavobacterium aquidurense]SHG38620.1 hypothetical protein SAMN05444481_10427 [Flavobacterium frigidimaris]